MYKFIEPQPNLLKKKKKKQEMLESYLGIQILLHDQVSGKFSMALVRSWVFLPPYDKTETYRMSNGPI